MQSPGAFESFDLEAALPEPLPDDPLPIFRAWYAQAHAQNATPNPNAMALATCDDRARPSVRIVLCKDIDDRAFVTFYTNRASRKGRELESTHRAAAVFHWDTLDRQARLEGPVEHAPDDVSDAYFASRPLLSRVGAWASQQSEPLASRADMLRNVEAAITRFGVPPAALLGKGDHSIPRPPHWGGYRLWIERLELWQGMSGRVHDRAVWTRTLADADRAPGRWSATRLQP
ncbi:MAG: pyridoxamine 5'-phosphate oxidase [Phycisphaeraceae bacterium]|nr:pyridoxamine 5'-phosphate oxidase [Phycisphaeraceae bacterium]